MAQAAAAVDWLLAALSLGGSAGLVGFVSLRSAFSGRVHQELFTISSSLLEITLISAGILRPTLFVA
jgi:hypothetical protein